MSASPSSPLAVRLVLLMHDHPPLRPHDPLDVVPPRAIGQVPVDEEASSDQLRVDVVGRRPVAVNEADESVAVQAVE